MTIDEQVAMEVKAVTERMALIDERVAKIRLTHEDIILIERLDHRKWRSTIISDPYADKVRMRTSWYGRILKVSEIPDVINELKEHKKGLVKPGQIISYNPDAAFSLNIDGFEELWVLSIENILIEDLGFDYLKAVEVCARNRAEVIENQKKIQEENARAAAILKVEREPIITGPIGPVIRVSGSEKEERHHRIEALEQRMDRFKK